MPFPDLPFLPAFVAVFEVGSITAAAAQLHRTQPTVSYQLAQLERALGAPLFVRHGRAVTPTDLAIQLHRLAIGFVRDLDRVRQGGESDALDVAAVSGFGRFVLCPLLRQLRSTRITLRYPTADEVFRRVADGEVDLGFTHRAVSRPHLVLEPVFRERLVLVANRRWRERLDTPAQFRDVPILTYDESDYVIGRWIGHHFGRRAPVWWSAGHFEELEEVIDFAADGTGVAIVPSFVLGSRRDVRVVEWGRPAAENTVFAVRRAGAPVHRVIEDLLEALRASSRGEARPARSQTRPARHRKFR